MRIRGFTFIEIVVTLVVVGVALVTLSALISRDMKTSTQNRWDEIAQAAVAASLEYHARVRGFNDLDNDRLLAQPIPEDQPMNPPELQAIPWRKIRRYVQRYPDPNFGNNPNPQILLLTVCLDTAESAAAAVQGQIRTWKASTLVVKNGFDKTPT